MKPEYPPIERRGDLTPEEFYRDYVEKKPVILTGALRCPALSKWSDDYFVDLGGHTLIKAKSGKIADGATVWLTLAEYIRGLQSPAEESAVYLHDFSLLSAIEQLRHDLHPFPLQYLPEWYRYKWWRNLFFFYGRKGSLTPLHFDNLGTHNLFFQVRGRKRFIIVPPSEHAHCYMHKYSWARVDPESPDFDRHPAFRRAHPSEGIVSPGDVLYMPPFTLHHVRGLDSCISMNIDWHTKSSVLGWLSKLGTGMHWSRAAYNMIYFAGIRLGVPPSVLYPLYRYYLMTG